ncbi:MAG: hypothetical protein LBL32_01310 [Holosporales bacterium]|jgi:hypothetical protein|nr:hypothetical protein [Holosporales bacterium]
MGNFLKICGVMVLLAGCMSSECCAAEMLNWMKEKTFVVYHAAANVVCVPFRVYRDYSEDLPTRTFSYTNQLLLDLELEYKTIPPLPGE